jgi:ABC-type amino acid transport substrate-binding protein
MNLERNYDDIAIASFVITKERQKNFFMAKYHSEQMVMLFNKKFNDFKNLDDFQKKTEKKDISSIYGVFNKDFIEWSKKNFENLKITYFFNEILTIYAMNKDFVSGVIMTKSEANSLKESNPNIYDFFELPNLKFDFGILIQKNNKKLYAKIVNAIQELENSKEMIELKEKYNIL